MTREIRPVYFIDEQETVSFRDEAEAAASGHTRDPEAFGVYEREADGTLTHIADFPSRREAEESAS